MSEKTKQQLPEELSKFDHLSPQHTDPQITGYSRRVIYGVDPDGVKTPVTQDKVLEAYGFDPKDKPKKVAVEDVSGVDDSIEVSSGSSATESRSERFKRIGSRLGKSAVERIKAKSANGLINGAVAIDTIRSKRRREISRQLDGDDSSTESRNYDNPVLKKYASFERTIGSNNSERIYGVDRESGRKDAVGWESILKSYGYEAKRQPKTTKANEADLAAGDFIENKNSNDTIVLDKIAAENPRLQKLLDKYKERSADGKAGTILKKRLESMLDSQLSGKDESIKADAKLELNALSYGAKNNAEERSAQKSEKIANFTEKMRSMSLKAEIVNRSIKLPSVNRAVGLMDSRMREYVKNREGLSDKQKHIALAIGALAISGVAIGMLYAQRKTLGEFAESYADDGVLQALPEVDVSAAGDEVWDSVDVGSSADSTPEIPQEFHSAEIKEGMGTSQFANQELGIDFDSRAEWDEFNSKTNHLFEGLDGTYEMPNGDIGFNTGGVQIPQEILDKMLEVAEDIKS